MDIFAITEQKRTRHQQKLKLARSQLKISAISGAFTVAAALWINANMDDGERFDLHQHVPQIVENTLKSDPTLEREVVVAQATDLADAFEKDIRLATVVFPLASGLITALWFNRKKTLERQMDDNPNLRPRDNTPSKPTSP